MARSFDYTASEYLSVSGQLGNPATISVAAWVSFDASTDTNGSTVINMGDHFGVILNNESAPAASYLRAFWYDTNYRVADDNTDYLGAGLIHILFVCNPSGSSQVLYVNGSSVATNTTSAALNWSANGTDTFIGRHGNGEITWDMNGEISEIGVWNSALTAADAATLAAGFAPPFVQPQNIIAYWPLIRDEDQDRTGGYDLTAFNTPTIAAHPPIIYPAQVHQGFTATAAGGSPYTLTAAQGSYALTGQTSTLTADRTIAAAQGAYALTGQDTGVYAARLLTAAQGSYALTGQNTTLTAARLLTAAQGSYGLTGQTSVLTIARLLTAAQGSYSLTGQDTALLVARLLTAAQGSYTLTGQDVTLTYTPLGAYTLTAEQGSYTLTGQAAGLLTARLLTAAQGSYALTGQDATLTYTPLGSYLLTAAQGSYSLTGQAAGLIADRTIAAGQGSYALTGQDAGLLAGRSLTAVQGSYTLTGIDTALIVARTLVAIYGSYTLTGQTAVLSYSGDISEGIILSGDVLIRLIAAAAANMRFTADGDVAARFTAEGDTEL